MHIFIQHDKNVYFFVKYILGIYHVYTRFGNDKGIYLVYTWYIPGKTFQGFPDVAQGSRWGFQTVQPDGALSFPRPTASARQSRGGREGAGGVPAGARPPARWSNHCQCRATAGAANL